MPLWSVSLLLSLVEGSLALSFAHDLKFVPADWQSTQHDLQVPVYVKVGIAVATFLWAQIQQLRESYMPVALPEFHARAITSVASSSFAIVASAVASFHPGMPQNETMPNVLERKLTNLNT